MSNIFIYLFATDKSTSPPPPFFSYPSPNDDAKKKGGRQEIFSAVHAMSSTNCA